MKLLHVDANAFVFATPMYNFSMSSVFKAFIDNIVPPT